MQFKDKLKKYFPISIVIAVWSEFGVYFFKYLKYSGVFDKKTKSNEKLLGKIIADYHVIEKGLTMPEGRIGFGQDKAMKTAKLCLEYSKTFDSLDSQVYQAIAVLHEYRNFHVKHGYKLKGDFNEILDRLLDLNEGAVPSKQLEFTKNEYFEKSKLNFEQFIKSRRSLRNYSDHDVSSDLIKSAVELAQFSPSSCNRQSSKAYLFEDKEQIRKILELQGGNRGFGHLANKVVIVVSELGSVHGVYEKNLPYVDGGIFSANLLNALHYYGIAACPLNCYFSASKDRKLREITKIKDSEVFVLMISCGYPPEEFKAALSKRKPISETFYIR